MMNKEMKAACEKATQTIIFGGRVLLKQCELTQESCHDKANLTVALDQLIEDCRVLSHQAKELRACLAGATP